MSIAVNIVTTSNIARRFTQTCLLYTSDAADE